MEELQVKTKTVTVAGREILVKELTWGDQLNILDGEEGATTAMYKASISKEDFDFLKDKPFTAVKPVMDAYSSFRSEEELSPIEPEVQGKEEETQNVVLGGL